MRPGKIRNIARSNINNLPVDPHIIMGSCEIRDIARKMVTDFFLPGLHLLRALFR
jgi:hypothetical protein